MLTLAAVKKEHVTALVETLHTIVSCGQSEEDFKQNLDMMSKSDKICFDDLCMCCIINLQSLGYLECKTDESVVEHHQDSVRRATLLGIKKYAGSLTAFRYKCIDTFSSIVNIHDENNEMYYLADTCPFADYTISFSDDDNEWLVTSK